MLIVFVLAELFHTERSHVRALKVLERIFYRPLSENQILPQEQLVLLFPNLGEMLDIHSNLNSAMKLKRKESPVVGNISELLLNTVSFFFQLEFGNKKREIFVCSLTARKATDSKEKQPPFVPNTSSRLRHSRRSGGKTKNSTTFSTSPRETPSAGGCN